MSSSSGSAPDWDTDPRPAPVLLAEVRPQKHEKGLRIHAHKLFKALAEWKWESTMCIFMCQRERVVALITSCCWISTWPTLAMSTKKRLHKKKHRFNTAIASVSTLLAVPKPRGLFVSCAKIKLKGESHFSVLPLPLRLTPRPCPSKPSGKR